MSNLKRYEMSVSATDFDGYQIFACFAENEQDATSKFKSGKSEIIESQIEVLGLESEPYDVCESDDISSRLSGDVISAKDARITELEEMLKRFIPSNDYPELGEDGEDVYCNYGGEFQYNDDSEHIGLEVVEILAKGGK